MEDINGWVPPDINMMHKRDSILEIKNNGSKFLGAINRQAYSLELTVYYPNNQQKKFSTIAAATSNNFIDETFKVDLNMSGEYRIVFELDYLGGDVANLEHITHNATTYIYVNPDNSSLKPYTLGDTIRRLLNLTPVRTVDELPKYTFNAKQLAEYDKEESPEFAFTGHTLFEALLIIAQYKGAFPVLNGNEISFRKLWNGTWLKESDLPAPIDEVSCSDINQYCTYLETEVQNLVGINDSQVGSIVEPYAGGYKTTRAASGSEISQDTAIIPTDYNQYLHIKEEIGYIGDEMPKNGDLTAYMYESGDYHALTDKSGAYPNSKAYALKWTQMSKNVDELAHRIQSNSSIAKAFKEPALANIINVKTGVGYDDGIVNYIQKLINPQSGSPSFADLMFRTTYIPVINARIKQYKENFADFHHDGSIKYNQTAELVDSEMYGEHLKELLRKLGNVAKQKIYIFDKMDDVPKVGTVVDGYSVYDVKMSIRENKVVATVSYVKYAELSKYIGVKNPWKDSDVSIDKCYNRQVSYNEFLLFTHDGTKKSTSKIFSEAALNNLLPGYSRNTLTCVEATGYMQDGEKLSTVLLPVVSLAMGNSIMFQWQYQNNYSAGYMSEEAPEGSKSLLAGTNYNRAQKAVKYSDMYGKMETYSFKLMPTGPVPKLDSNGLSDLSWWDSETSGTAAPDKVMRNIAHSLPLKPNELRIDGYIVGQGYPEWQGEHYISVDDLVVEKNSSEALTFSVQLHYCADNENFIVGSGLANYCPLVGGRVEGASLKICCFKTRINIFDRHIDIKSSDLISCLEMRDVQSGGIKLIVPSTINDKDADGNYLYNSWAYVAASGGKYQIIFGENRDFKGSEFKTELYLLPMRKLEDFI